MQNTQQMIEKYMAEMQKLYDKSKKIPTENKSEPELKAEAEAQNDEVTKIIDDILNKNIDVSLNSDKPLLEDELFEPSLPTIVEAETPPNNELTASEEESISPSQISRSCIRGGALANASFPANTNFRSGEENLTSYPLSDIGTLKIEVFEANRAIPIVDAVVRVKTLTGDEILNVSVTDRNGSIDNIELPAPDRSLSTSPEAVNPYVNYLVDIRTNGYVPQNNLEVQMFGGTLSILSANLIPEI